MADSKQWFSFSENGNYHGSEPYFFNISEKSFTKILESNYQIILAELQDIILNDYKNIVPYYNQTLASTPSSWTIFPLIMWGKQNTDNCTKAPKTLNIIKQIKGVTTCGFSILKPNTKIKPHDGDSNVMYRCHLPLKCLGTLPNIGFRVGSDTTTWELGKLISFCDAYNHEVWNNTNEERWVLIVDILREEFLVDEKKICAKVNASLWWQFKFQKHYFFKHMPKWCRKWLMNITSIFMKH